MYKRLSGLALLTAASFYALAATSAPVARVSDYNMKPQKIADNVYAVITPARDFPNEENKGWNSNCAFVVTPEGVLVFDTGTSAAIGAALRKTIASVTDKPVKWIINSHGHGDHWLGNISVADKGTEIIATDMAKARAEKEGLDWVDRFKGMTGGATGDTKPLAPNKIINGKSSRNFGGVKVALIPSDSSHSTGDVLAWLPQQKILLAGDVVYTNRLPGVFDSKMQQWIKFLGELEKLKPAVVVPGHGDVGDIGDITRMKNYLQDFWQAVSKGFAAGKSDFEMRADVVKALDKYKQRFIGFDKYIGTDISNVYLKVEEAAF